MITSTIRKRIGWALGAAMGLFYFSSGVSAQMDPKAWDNASQSAYSGGSWANGSNGGSGFNAWSIVYTGGDWKGSYAGNPAEKGLSGMTNPSWGMYAHTAAGNKVEATRTFTALAVGDELSFKWAFNWDSGSTPGKGIKIFAGASQVIDINNAGNANITVNGVNTAFGYGVNAMTWTIKRINTTQLTITANDRDGSGTYTTTITAGAPTSIQFYINRQSDNNGNREPFFNDLKIQPTVKYNQTITFAEGAWQSKTYGDANFNLSATASSGLTVSFASSDTSVATVSGNTVTILKAGTTTITASQAGNNNYNAATSVQRTLTVSKKNPTVSGWPTATAITLGQTLSDSSLVGGSSTPAGSFAWTNPSYEPTEAGTASYSVTFTPTDTVNYNTAQNDVSLTVNEVEKQDPVIDTWPTSSAITYGQTLASSTLSGGSANVDGHFEWSDDTIVPVVGSPAQSVTFYPDDDEAYNTAISTVAITVNKADPSVTTWPTASAITYGQTLASSTLSGGSATPAGSFAFTTPSTAPDIGTAAQSVTYTPTDTANYNTAQSTVSVTVNKATPTITTPPTASIIFVGDSLADSTLSGGAASVDGTFAFTTPSTTPARGTADQSVTFTPTDGTRYNTVQFNVSVSVWYDAITFYAKTPSWADHNPNDPQVWGPFVAAQGWSGHTMTYDSESGWWSAMVEVLDSTAEITYQWRFCEATATKYQKAIGGATDPTFTTTTGEIWIDGSSDTSYTWYGANDFALAPAAITDGGELPEPTPVMFYARIPSWADGAPNGPVIWGPFTTSEWTDHAMTYDSELGWWKVEVDVLDASAAITYQLRFSENGTNKYQKATGDDTFATDATFTTTTDAIWIDGSQDSHFVWSEGDNFYLLCGRVTETEPALETVTFYARTPSWADHVPDNPQIWGPFLGDDCWSVHTMTYDTELGWWKVEVDVLDASAELTYLLRFCELGTPKWQKATGDDTFSIDPTFTTTTDEIWIDGSDDANFVWPLEGDAYYLIAGAITETQPKDDQTITFEEGAWQSKTYGDAAFDLVATASSGLDVSFESLNTAVATISGDTVTIVGAGTATIRATQAGNSAYNAATPVDRVLTVSKANQTITFAEGAWQTKTFGDPDFDLVASASSGLTVSFQSLDTDVATIDGDTVTIVAVGTVTIRATQAGNDNYNAATAVDRVLQVKSAEKEDVFISVLPTAGAITYGQTLADSALSGGSATNSAGESVAGTFEWTDDTIVPVVGGPAQNVTFYPTDDETYNTANGDVSITVNKADPSVTTWPTASAITYGQTLADSTLSDGEATPEGTFTFTTPSTAPDIGTEAQSVTFTPTDTANYNTAQSTVNVTVNKATPTITTPPTASVIFVGDSLADSTLSDGVASVDGSFAFTTPSTTPERGTADQLVTFTPTDGTRYNPVEFNVSVSVWYDAITFYAKTPSWEDGNPDDPSIWGPFTGVDWTGYTMTYDSESGWWSAMVEVLDSTAEITYQWRFCEATATKYQKAIGGATDPTFTTTTGEIWIDGSSDTSYTWYGANDFALAPAAITDGGELPEPTPVMFYARIPSWADGAPNGPVIWGPFTTSEWTDHAMTYDSELGWWKVEVDVLDASAAITYQLRFSENGTNKYQKATGDDTFATDATFTTTTDAIWIDGSQDSHFVWSEGDNFYLLCGRVTETEPALETVTFYARTPSWADHVPDNPQIWGPFLGDDCWSVHTMTYDTELGWWKVEVDVLDASAELTYLLRFCELGTPKWQKATGDDTFSIDPTFTTTTDEIWIDGSDDANFVWPLEGDAYYLIAGAITETQPKDDQTITFEEGAWQSKTYGDAAFDLVATASSGLDVSFESLNTAVATISGDTVTIVGAGTATIRATQAGNSAYNAATPVDRVLTVSKANQTITFAEGAWQTKTFGDPDFDLVASASSGLTVSFQSLDTDVATIDGDTVTIVAVGTVTIRATQAGNDNYNAATAVDRVLQVKSAEKEDVFISVLPTAGAITYGQTLADSALSGGSATNSAGESVAGTFEWTDDTIVPVVGGPAQNVTFYPTDDETYNTANGDVSITVNKADPSVTTWPTASAITYGQTLADSTLSGGEASVAGSFDWTTPATAPAAGTADQSVTFTPTDADNYETVVFDVSVTVGKAIPTITTEPTASAITYGQTLADSTLSGGEASVAGAFDWTTPATAPDVGTADQSVTFTPTDADNYEAVVFDVSVTVGKATPTITTPPEAGNIVVGQTLASSTLSGGEASVAGSFAWTDDSIEPLEGKADQSVTFTPTDGDNYETVVFDVSVTTLATEPEEHSASMAVTDPTAESLTLTWTIGSGERRIVVVRALYAVNWTPTDGVSPTGVNVDFSAAADQGNGNKICYDGAGNSVTLTGLTPNTLYWFKVFEYNGSKFGAKGLNTTGTENYYTDDIPLEGSGSTLPTSVVLYYFVAGAENGQAVLRWRTASEIDTVGFWVERQVGGAWMRVNDKIIYGKGEMGATYALVDAGAEIGGTYTWRIVEIETDGGQQIHGPFTRTVSELGFAAENPITVTPDGVLIRWLSREGESYKILRSTDLTQGFGVIEEDISATVPENEFLDETAGSIGMYLIQVDDE